MPPRYQALVFDVGGVVLGHDNAMLYARLASRCQPDCPPDDIEAAVQKTEWGNGVAPIAELHRRLSKDFGYSLGWDAFVADWCCHFAIDRSMLAFLNQLSKRNRVILFSNTNQVHWHAVVAEPSGIMARFERYLSHEIGYRKPDLAAYESVARRAAIDPTQCLFFDDTPENVEGARRAGFQAELFVNEAELRRFLSSKNTY